MVSKCFWSSSNLVNNNKSTPISTFEPWRTMSNPELMPTTLQTTMLCSSRTEYLYIYTRRSRGGSRRTCQITGQKSYGHWISRFVSSLFNLGICLVKSLSMSPQQCQLPEGSYLEGVGQDAQGLYPDHLFQIQEST